MKFVILHHGACNHNVFHYRVERNGAVRATRPESEPGGHAHSVAIVVAGDCEVHPPTDAQIDGLKALLLDIKKRFPDVELGGHRQVRGNDTTCPGRHFPLTELRRWAATELVARRDAAMQDVVDRQYRP